MWEQDGNVADGGRAKGRPNKIEDKFGIFFKLENQGQGGFT
jgi:hypothetical protein